MKRILIYLLILLLLFNLKSQFDMKEFFCEPKKYRFSKKNGIQKNINNIITVIHMH